MEKVSTKYYIDICFCLLMHEDMGTKKLLELFDNKRIILMDSQSFSYLKNLKQKTILDQEKEGNT